MHTLPHTTDPIEFIRQRAHREAAECFPGEQIDGQREQLVSELLAMLTPPSAPEVGTTLDSHISAWLASLSLSADARTALNKWWTNKRHHALGYMIAAEPEE